jgi:tetratricopeptide (TPR) repeat protein
VRFLDHHLHTAANADRAIRTVRAEQPLTPRDPVVEVVEFANRDDAVAWCLREHDMLLELCEFALANGHHDHVWLIPSSLAGYLQIRGSTEDFLRLYGGALDGARQSGNRVAEAMALTALGNAQANMHEFEEAHRLLSMSLQIRYEIGEPRGIAVCEHELGHTSFHRKNHDEALHHLRTAVEHWRLAGDDGGRIKSMNGLAWVLLDRGDFAQSARIADETADLCARLGITDPLLQNTRAKAKFKMGDVEGAARLYRTIFAGPLDHIVSTPLVRTLLNGTEVFQAVGDREAALRCAREALTVTERGGLPRADEIRELIRELEA